MYAKTDISQSTYMYIQNRKEFVERDNFDRNQCHKIFDWSLVEYGFTLRAQIFSKSIYMYLI